MAIKRVKKIKKNNYKPIKSWLYALIAILVVVTGVYARSYFEQSNKLPKNTIEEIPPMENNYSNYPTSTQPTITVDPMVYTNLSDAWNLGTKTFTNPKLKISFDYPKYFEANVVDMEKENKTTLEKYKDYPDVKRLLYGPEIDFAGSINTPTQAYAINCPNKMSVYIRQIDNPTLSVYDFIAKINKTYPGDGTTNTFDEYKKWLKATDIPKPGSFIFTGVLSENPVKQAYFENNGKIFIFSLHGNCDTGGMYTPDAEKVFEKILKSIRYL